MKRFWLSMTLAAGLSLLYTGVVYAQGTTPPTDAAQTGEIAAKLAGLVAAATVIERIIELIWDFVENNFLTASKAVENATDYVSWAKKQVQTARENLITSTTTSAEEKSKLETALIDAEKRLSEYLQSPVYVTLKKKISVPLAIIFGLVIAWKAELQMLFLLDILPADSALKPIDIIITGLVIGTGSAPVHSLIGILQNTKDTINSARALYSGKAIADAMTEIKKQSPPQRPATVGGLRELVETFDNQPDGASTSSGLPPQKSPVELERAARRMVKL